VSQTKTACLWRVAATANAPSPPLSLSIAVMVVWCCTLLQCSVMCYSVRCSAVWAFASAESFDRRDGSLVLHSVAVQCDVLQCVLQSVAVQCDVLQFVFQCSVSPRLR